MLLVAGCCQIGYSATNLTLDDLLSSGESWVVTSDSTLTIGAGETAVVDDVSIEVNGTDDAVTVLKIVNNGELVIDSTTIRCNHANLTIQNLGSLTLQTCHFTITGNSTLSVDNENECNMNDFSCDVYGGFAYIKNKDTLTIENGYFKDQFDGTFFTNYGNATLHGCTFVANGAEGKIELFSSGDLQVSHGVFDVNYGGTVNINTLTGTLNVNGGCMDVSGSSHGKKSEINILGDKATWKSCFFVNNDAKINYLNTGELYANACIVDVSSNEASTILTNNGPTVFENLQLSGSGSTIITNWESMTLIDGECNSSSSLNLMNNGELTAENWLVKTTSNTASITVYNSENATIAFDAPFIEGVESSVLAAVGPEGQEFVEESGGTITVTNKGSINKSNTGGDSDSPWIYVLAIAVVAVVVVVVFFMAKKKKT
jgi:hypothetical protein